MLQKPRGTRDFLPDEMERRRLIEQRMREVSRRWGYREVSTPDFEHLELFTMKSGEGIIQEMYTFEDKGGRPMTLRPEVTASVLRMYVNEGKVSQSRSVGVILPTVSGMNVRKKAVTASSGSLASSSSARIRRVPTPRWSCSPTMSFDRAASRSTSVSGTSHR